MVRGRKNSGPGSGEMAWHFPRSGHWCLTSNPEIPLGHLTVPVTILCSRSCSYWQLVLWGACVFQEVTVKAIFRDEVLYVLDLGGLCSQGRLCG